ncbi:MAG TPA: ATP-dependent DNA helicase RecG [Acidimicrobiales bacterium]|nr:ATP-dependent DNA helicase RecG [Acidimicrobiales bacterium]
MSEAAPRRLRQLGEISVEQLRHVGDKRAQSLAQLGVTSVFDLLTLYPRRYMDRTKRADLSDLAVGDEAAIFAEVTSVRSRRTRQGRSMVEVKVSDDSGSINIVFFNQPWRERQLGLGVQALFFAAVGDYRGQRQMTNPVVDVIIGPSGEERDASRVGRIVPIYPASGKAGLTSWELGGFVEEALRRAGPLLDPVPPSILEPLDLVDRTRSLWGIHLPADVDEVTPARRRLVFDEFLRVQLILALRRQQLEASASAIRHRVDPADLDVAPGADVDDSASLVRQFLSGHHFALTGAQRRVLGEIAADMASGLPMHRLLQGDVGSGKTLVALCTLLMARDGARQGALMAPTEILAEQHLVSLRADLEGLSVADPAVLGGARPLNVQLLTGRLRARERQAVLAGLAEGSVDFVIGTHALLSDDVRFRALGVIVIDEQHRFGVEQRATLRDKGREHSEERLDPDLLVMTATPIPRTAAMVVFGDLDRSVLDELPGGRVPVTTQWLRAHETSTAWQRVRDEVAQGFRAFVVCPLVEGSERVEAASAVEERDRLVEHELKGLRVGLLHAQMKSDAKDDVMARFRGGLLDVLVATVVIEVGVDILETSVVVIEDAWRFGLAQLHQLRGRVGRGTRASYCYVLGDPPSEDGVARLEALVGSSDGFELAEIDLDLRGEGTLFGTRQRGRSDLRLASLRHDEDLLVAAQAAAASLARTRALADQPDLVDELKLFVDDQEAQYLFKS